MGTTYPGDPVYVTQLLPGSYVVGISMPDYQAYTETVSVKAGDMKVVTAAMVPVTPGPVADGTGQVTVGSTPAGASVYLDSVYRGVTPMLLTDVAAGSHTLMLRESGYQDWTSSVAVTGGGYTAISGTLVAGTTTAHATPAPQTTKSGLPVFIPLAGIGAALLVMGRRE
jgi:hypothetical protein